MLNSKEDLLKEVEFLEDGDLYNVMCFYSDSTLSFNDIISGSNLKKSLNTLQFDFCGGAGLREFYVSIDNFDYTLQILDNEVDIVKKLSF